MVYLAGPALHRDPDLYPRPNDFCPERFLTEQDSGFAKLPKYAYRPFELGPRTCIGQELALLQLRVLLVLLARTFYFEPDYQGESTPANSVSGFGDRAYQAQFTTAKPKDGIPMRVTKIQREAALEIQQEDAATT